MMGKRSTSITIVGLALGSLLLAGSPAGAQSVYAPSYGWSGHTNSAWGGNTNDPRIERREAYQEQRIQQGINSGSLNREEARYLNREQARIDRVEDRMLTDGNLSPRERQRLNQMQNQASRDIYRLEHNNQTIAGYNGNQPGWQGHDRGWNGRDNGWHGNNPVGAGNTPGGNGYNHGWQGNGNSGWHGNNPGGSGHTPGGTTTAGNTQGWHGSGNSGWQGNAPAGSGHTPSGTTPGGATPAGNIQGGPGNFTRNGQPGAYQQPGAQAATRPGQPSAWQGQQQYQRPPNQGAQLQMRPNVNMTPRQPSGVGAMVNRANFSVPRAAPRR